MTRKYTPGKRLLRDMDAELKATGEDLGEQLEWSADERVMLERAAQAADRAEELRAEYNTEREGKARSTALTRLSAEIRMLDRMTVDLVGRVNVGVGPAKNPAKVRAANARWRRHREQRGA